MVGSSGPGCSPISQTSPIKNGKPSIFRMAKKIELAIRLFSELISIVYSIQYDRDLGCPADGEAPSRYSFNRRDGSLSSVSSGSFGISPLSRAAVGKLGNLLQGAERLLRRKSWNGLDNRRTSHLILSARDPTGGAFFKRDFLIDPGMHDGGFQSSPIFGLLGANIAARAVQSSPRL